MKNSSTFVDEITAQYDIHPESIDNTRTKDTS